MDIPKREESSIDAIEHQLYDPKVRVNDGEIHHTRPHREMNLPTSWGDDAPIIIKGQEERGFSFGVKLLMIATVLLFLSLAFSTWRVLSLRNVVSAENIDMTADITPFIEGGETTKLILTLHNRNASPLENSSVTLLYKQGNGSQDEQEKIQDKKEVGSIKTNEYKKQDFPVTLYGAEGESRDLTVKLEYKVSGSNATFSKIVTTQVVLRAPPIAVHIDGPEKLSVGQIGSYTINIKNNSASTSLPSTLMLTLPNSFTIVSTQPQPITRSSSWSIDALPSGASKTITLTGSFDGKQDEVATIQAKIGSKGDSQTAIGIVYSSESKDITLHDSPLTLVASLFSDHGGTDVIRYGDRATVSIGYSNTSNQALEDVSIKLTLSGDAAVYENINPTNGYYDSQAKTITWNQASIPDLAVLAPNAQGTLQIVVPIVAKGNNSPVLKVSLVGTAGVKEADMVTTVIKTWGVQGSATLNASTQYKTSPFPNTGPIPPEPNQETTYTAHLAISAQNALSSARVSFTLPAYVTWKGITSDPKVVSYDTRTRTVTWDTGPLAQGVVAALDISLSVRPSQSHVGQTPAITSGIILDADEEVSRSHIRTTLSPLTTAIRNESWPSNPSIVISK